MCGVRKVCDNPASKRDGESISTQPSHAGITRAETPTHHRISHVSHIGVDPGINLVSGLESALRKNPIWF